MQGVFRLRQEQGFVAAVWIINPKKMKWGKVTYVGLFVFCGAILVHAKRVE